MTNRGAKTILWESSVSKKMVWTQYGICLFKNLCTIPEFVYSTLSLGLGFPVCSMITGNSLLLFFVLLGMAKLDFSIFLIIFFQLAAIYLILKGFTSDLVHRVCIFCV